MSTQHVEEELSAYLDGEAADPERIANHLRACTPCAQKYEALKNLSAQLRALSPPDVSPAFVARVMAHVREEPPQTRRLWRRLAVPLALAATLAGVLIGGAFYVRATPPAELPAPGAITVARAASQDPITLVELESEWRAGENAGWCEEAYSLGAAPDPSLDEMVEGLANTDWFDGMASYWVMEEDVEALLCALDEEETDILEQLLQTYAEEGQTI